MTDPRANRRSGLKCSTCMWFSIKVQSSPSAPASPVFGRCQRHAPTISGYPAVFGGDWCGDHKLDENKLEVQTPSPMVVGVGSGGRTPTPD